MTRSATMPTASAGELLKQWRGRRGLSQLDLALDAGISQKHLSFVETGRSVPSRQVLVGLADALDVPLRERNTLIVAAGYAPMYRDEPLDDAMAQQVGRAVKRLLRQHEPFPAVVLDRYWNVVETNDAAPVFFGRFVDLNARSKPRNLLHLVFDPAGLQPHLVDFPTTARSLLVRLHREAPGAVIDDQSRALLAGLMAYPGAPQDIGAARPADVLPMIPLRFRTGDTTFDLFSMITTVGTPQTVASQELRVETMFPTDEANEEAYFDFMGNREA